MKKTKNTSATPETKSVVENDLAFILFDSNNHEWINNDIAQALLKTKSEVSLFIVSGKETELLQQQNLNELHAKNRCTILSIEDWKSGVEQSKYNWFFVLDKYNAAIATQAASFFSANKKNFTQKAVYTGEINKKSGKEKLGIWQKVKNGFFNFVSQILTPTGQKDFTLQFHFFHKEILLRSANSFTHSTQNVLSNAAYLNQKMEPVTLTVKEAQTRKINWKLVWGNAVTARLNWFLREPLKTKSDWWRPAFMILTVLAMISMLVMSQQYGMTWDEKRHNDYSKESLKYFMSMGEDTTCLSEHIPTQEFRFYGEHFNVIAAFLYTYILPTGEFETRHLLNAFYGFIAMLFVAMSAKEIGSWRMGTLALLFIFFSPVFFAHSMNNPTDIPFATGFAIALYYFIRILKTLPSPKFSSIFMAAVGVGMAVGSRVGGILLYAYAGLFFGIHFLAYFKKNKFTYFWNYVKTFVWLVVIGHLLSVSLWPFGQQHIFTNWYVALKKSTEGAYFTYNHELFEGVRMYMAKVPWYYLPKFMIINSPLFVLGGALLILVLSFVWKKVFTKTWVFIPMVLFALVFPIVYAEYQSMYYYNGWRHYLFTYPPLVILAATGWEALLRLGNNKIVRYAVAIVLIALFVNPIRFVVANHPNECVYFNELVGGIKGAYGKYEMDYYSNSCRAAGEWLAKQVPNKKILVAINNEPQTAAYYAQKINPNIEFKWVREYEEERPMWDYEILTSRTYSKNELLNGSFPPKGTVHTIEVDGVPIAAVVKREDWNMPLGYRAEDSRNVDSAIYYFTNATTHAPADEEAWRMLGQSYLMKGSGDSAIRALNKSIEIFPENYMAYSLLGQVYVNLNKDYPKALECFKKSTDIKFNYTDGYYYAAACYLGQNDYLGAIPWLENALKRGGSGIPEIYYNLGIAYLYTNNNKKAEENLVTALSLNQNFARGYYALAEVYKRENRQQEAQACMQRFQQLGGQ